MKPDLSTIPTIERGGPVPHLSLPHREIIAWHEQQGGETIRDFVDRTRLEDGPPIVVYELDDEGKPTAILRAEWHRPIADVRPLFVSCPMGGGGGGGGGSKSVLGVVGMIAIMALSSFIPGALELTGIVANLASAAIMVGGGLLISHFMRPKAPTVPAPTYDFQLGNNTARPGQPIPVQYGRLKFMPDFSDAPWSDYGGLDQTYHALLCLGVGEFDIEEIGVNTTPIWTAASGFSAGFGGTVAGNVQAHTGEAGDVQGTGGDFQFQMVGPGGTPTLFPSSVSASPDVSGQELPVPYTPTAPGPGGETSGPNKVGPFVLNAAGTVARVIAIDVSFPSGLYHIGSGGSLRAGECYVGCDIQYVDDQGHALGNWQTLFTHYFNYATRSPWRETIWAEISPGRVQVRCYRTTPLDPDGQTGVNWIGARAYVDGPTTRANVSQLAIKAKADKLLSGWSSQRLYVIATRRIPVWVAAQANWVTQATRNPFWAMCDLWADTRYGGAQSRNKLDIPTMMALAAGCDTRHDYFDHRFTSRQSLVDALTLIAGSALAQPLPLWDTLSAVRDEPRSLPRTVLTDFEIVRGSLKMNYKIAPANPTDGVVGQYFDNSTWAMQEVSSTGTVANLQNPSRVVLEGVTDRDQAYRNVIYLDRANRYRRAVMSLEIEGEGRLLKRGDLVVVSSELPGSWGGSYRIDATNVRILTLHTAHDWTAAGQRYIRIKGPHGEAFGPVKCSRYGADNVVLVDATDLGAVQTQQGLLLSDMLARQLGAENPSAVISIGAAQEFQGLVHEIAQGSQEGHIRLDLAPYAADLIYPNPTNPLNPLPAAPSLVLPKVPGTITGLGASLSQEKDAFTLTLSGSWQPDAGSEDYEAQYSLDQKVWSGLYSGPAANFSQAGFSGANLWLRVRGRRGNLTSIAWSQVAVTAPALTISIDNLGYVVKYDDISTALIDALHFGQIEALDDLASVVAQSGEELRQQITEVKSETGAAQAGVTQAMTAITGATRALADYKVEVQSAFGQTSAIVTQEIQTVADATSAVASDVSTLNVEIYPNGKANPSAVANIESELQAKVGPTGSITSSVQKLTAAVYPDGDTNPSSIATISNDLQAKVGPTGSITQQINDVEAVSNAGTASGRVRFVAVSGGTGVAAAYDIQVATTVGGTYSSAGLRLECLVGGGSRIVATADSFYIANGTLKKVPFSIDASGNITLAGVTYLASTLRSNATTAGGLPVWQLDPTTGKMIWSA